MEGDGSSSRVDRILFCNFRRFLALARDFDDSFICASRDFRSVCIIQLSGNVELTLTLNGARSFNSWRTGNVPMSNFSTLPASCSINFAFHRVAHRSRAVIARAFQQSRACRGDDDVENVLVMWRALAGSAALGSTFVG